MSSEKCKKIASIFRPPPKLGYEHTEAREANGKSRKNTAHRPPPTAHRPPPTAAQAHSPTIPPPPPILLRSLFSLSNANKKLRPTRQHHFPEYLSNWASNRKRKIFWKMSNSPFTLAFSKKYSFSLPYPILQIWKKMVSSLLAQFIYGQSSTNLRSKRPAQKLSGLHDLTH